MKSTAMNAASTAHLVPAAANWAITGSAKGREARASLRAVRGTADHSLSDDEPPAQAALAAQGANALGAQPGQVFPPKP